MIRVEHNGVDGVDAVGVHNDDGTILMHAICPKVWACNCAYHEYTDANVINEGFGLAPGAPVPSCLLLLPDMGPSSGGMSVLAPPIRQGTRQTRDWCQCQCSDVVSLNTNTY
jgi:hypothetical protein